MSTFNIREELLTRYIQTGKVGLCRPKNRNEALFLIETVVEFYEHQNHIQKEMEEVTYSLKDLSQRLNFLLK